MSSRLRRLSALGQSVWIDYLPRDVIASGALAKAVEEEIASCPEASPVSGRC
jgi:hypothetical protein